MNLDDFSPDLLLARGRYATVRSEHENAKGRMAALCGEVASLSAQILRLTQPDNEAEPDRVAISNKLDQCRLLVEQIDAASIDIGMLAAQRAELKKSAWPKTQR